MDQNEFVKRYEVEKPMYEAWADFVQSQIDNELKRQLGSHTAYYECVKIPPSSRVKTVNSLVAKAFVRKRGKYKNPYEDITDKAGIRFVVLLTQQLSILSQIVELNGYWAFSKDKEFDEWKDDDPRMFDYQSVHYVVKASKSIEHKGEVIAEGTPCEIQLRTLMQHAYAELAHDTIYKGNIKASPTVHRYFAKSMALMETTDDLLCTAKNALEEATIDATRWLDTINEESRNRLADLTMVEENKSTGYFVDCVNTLLSKVSIEDFQSFLDNPDHSFIIDRIKNHQEERGGIEFESPFILLAYFLSRRFRTIIKNHWPLDFEVLQRIFNDLGLAPNWAEK